MPDAQPPTPSLNSKKAFALVLEAACREFEALQAFTRKEIKIIPVAVDPQATPIDELRKTAKVLHAEAAVLMALAKSFLFNARRANRICTKNKSALNLDRLERTRFLKATDQLTRVRDVNEHGYDGIEDLKPSMHSHGGDETSLMIQGPEMVYMGPLNLYAAYVAVDRMRKLAGFESLIRKQEEATGAPC
jgi:hypothetical protein